MTHRNASYLRFVREHASCLTWDKVAPFGYVPLSGATAEGLDPEVDDVWVQASVAHHVRMGGGGGVGLKPSDYRAVPLTDVEHRELHQKGEASFWRRRGVSPDEVIISLLTSYCGKPGEALAEKFVDDPRALLAALEDEAEAGR